MTAEDWKRVQAVFDAATRHDPEERDAFLDEACAGKPWLRTAVASLLRGHDTGGIIDPSAIDAVTRVEVSPASDAIEGRLIGPYIIRHEIGRGGMGVVYLADDTRLSRRVALKALAPGMAREPGRWDRLRQEARAAAALSHPGIATVYALEDIGGELYLACEFVPGQTLRAALEAGPLPLPQVIDTATQIARALAAAHSQGVVHRDLKPENVVITATGQVKILDFGIARIESITPKHLTQTGTIIGTPGYMAPEQILTREVDARADLFSFGVLVYEMASGSNPFDGGTLPATIGRILAFEPAALSESCPASVPGLDRIVATCLSKHPPERYKSAHELVVDLERLQADLSAEPNRTGSRRRADVVEPDAAIDVLTPRTGRIWWRTHQVAIMALYVIATTRAWQIKEWVKGDVAVSVFLALGIGSMIGGTIRGHLIFTEVFNRTRLAEERRRTRRIIVAVDLLMAAALMAGVSLLVPAEPLSAVMTMSLALGIALATLLMEPATTAAAFGDDRAP